MRIDVTGFTQVSEVKIIEPDEAAAILQPKITELEAAGWVVMVQHDYMARLTRGKRNLDVQVDLLGVLHLEEKPLTPAQESGQIVAIILLILILFLVLVLATVLRLF